MLQWVANGIELGWLMVPQEQCVFIYSPGSEPEIVDGDFVVGDGPAEEFFIFSTMSGGWMFTRDFTNLPTIFASTLHAL
jgi:hypothetical protein